MNKPVPSPSRTDIKRAAILQAAKTVFLQQGYAETSMDTIALAAKVSKRTVYDHFKTKKALFETILRSHWGEMVEIEISSLQTLQDSRRFLKHFAKTFLQFVYQPDTIALFRLLIAESPQFPDLMAHLVHGGKPPFTRALITFLTRKKQAGVLKIKHPDRIAAYFFGMLKEYHFWPMLMGLDPNPQPAQLDSVINEVVDVFIQSFFSESPE